MNKNVSRLVFWWWRRKIISLNFKIIHFLKCIQWATESATFGSWDSFFGGRERDNH
jgi:hypothetical protein